MSAGLQVTDIKDTKVTIQWTAPGKMPMSYLVALKDPKGQCQFFQMGEDREIKYNSLAWCGNNITDVQKLQGEYIYVQGLDENKRYKVKVWKIKEDGTLGNSISRPTESFTTKFTIPKVSNFKSNVINDSTIRLTWVSMETYPGLTSYVVTVYDSNSRKFTNVTVPSSDRGTEINNLKPCTDYKFSIISMTQSGDRSGISSTTGRTKAGQVLNLEQVPEDKSTDSITIRWSPPRDLCPVKHAYVVFAETGKYCQNVIIDDARNFPNLTNGRCNIISYDNTFQNSQLQGTMKISDLQPGTSYTISVAIYNTDGFGEKRSIIASTISARKTSGIYTFLFKI